MFKHADEKQRYVADTTEHEVSVAAEDARAAMTKEHSLRLQDALRAYPRAIMWSLLLSSAVIMEGYDTILVSCQLGTEERTKLTHFRSVRTLDSHPSTDNLVIKSSTEYHLSLPRGKRPSRMAHTSARSSACSSLGTSSDGTATEMSWRELPFS